MYQQSAKGRDRLPEGVVVGRYSTYEEAQAAVTKVSESDAEVAGLAIVGSDLKLVERIVGKLTYGKVALSGAMRGLSFGVLIGLVYFIIVPSALQNLLLFPILGVAFGILLGVVTHSLTRRRRDFSSVQQVLASRYEVVAPNEIAGRVTHVLGPQRQASAPAADAMPVQLPAPGSQAAPGSQPGPGSQAAPGSQPGPGSDQR